MERYVSSHSCDELAPGVSRLIRQSLTESEKSEHLLSTLSETLCEVTEHRMLKREAGVNFNPMPARLIEILFREAKVIDPQEAETALGYARGETLEVLRTSPSSPAALAFALDVARHMHRSVLPEEERVNLLSALRDREVVTENDSRLAILYCAAIERLEKITW